MNLHSRYLNHERAVFDDRLGQRLFLTDARSRLFVMKRLRTNTSFGYTTAIRFISRNSSLPPNRLWSSEGVLKTTRALAAIEIVSREMGGSHTSVRVDATNQGIVFNRENGYWTRTSGVIFYTGEVLSRTNRTTAQAPAPEPERSVTPLTDHSLTPESPMPFSFGQKVGRFLDSIALSRTAHAAYAIMDSRGYCDKRSYVCYGSFTGNLRANGNAIIVDRHNIGDVDTAYRDAYLEVEQWIRTEGPFNKAFMYSGVHGDALHTIQNCAKLGPGPVMFNLLLAKYFRRGFVYPYKHLRDMGFSVREAMLTCLSIRYDYLPRNSDDEAYYPTTYWADWQPYNTQDSVASLLKLFTEEFESFDWTYGQSMFENLSKIVPTSLSVYSNATRVLPVTRRGGFGSESRMFSVTGLAPLATYYRGALNEIEGK